MSASSTVPTTPAVDAEGIERLRRIDPISVGAFIAALFGVAIIAVPLGHLALHRAKFRPADVACTDSRWFAVCSLVAGYFVIVLLVSMLAVAWIATQEVS